MCGNGCLFKSYKYLISLLNGVSFRLILFSKEHWSMASSDSKTNGPVLISKISALVQIQCHFVWISSKFRNKLKIICAMYTIYLWCDVSERFWILTKIALDGHREKNGILHHFNVRLVNFIDRIEYDVTAQISALQDGVCVRVCECMCQRNQTGNAAWCVLRWCTRLDAHTVCPTRWRLS